MDYVHLDTRERKSSDSDFVEIRVEETFWDRWKWTILSGAGSAAFIALRVLSDPPWARVVWSLGSGFSLKSMAISVFSTEALPHVLRVFDGTFGQNAIFGTTQWQENTSSLRQQKAADSMILAIYASFLAGQAKSLYDRWGVKNESHFSTEGTKFKGIFLPSKGRHLMRVAMGVACVFAFCFATNPLFQSLTLYGITRTFIAPIGEILSDHLDKKIEEGLAPSEPQPFVGNTHFTPLLDSNRKIQAEREAVWASKWKVAINTLALFTPYLYVPYKEITGTFAGKTIWPLAVGALAAFFRSFQSRSLQRRFERVPIKEELRELHCRPELTGSKWKKGAYLAWAVAIPAIFYVGVIWFWGCQVEGFACPKGMDPLGPDETLAKRDLGLMTLASFLTLPLLYIIDRSWNLEERVKHPDPTLWMRVKDKLITMNWVDRSFFGIDPIEFYFFAINYLELNSDALSKETNSFEKGISGLAWWVYGFEMMRECFPFWGSRNGLLFNFSFMVQVHGARTVVEMIRRNAP